MQRSGSATLFLVLVASATAFIWATSQSLPEITASHFGASGLANGFMPRDSYVRFMLVFVVVLPAVLVFLPGLGLSHPKARINLPNREYWLAPARRAETIQFLRRQMAHFGSMLVAFLCYVHWLVVRANAVVPPRLPNSWFIAGLVVFVIATLVWAWVFVGRFRNTPR